MAQFDFYRAPDGVGYVLDCQADILAHLNTRLVVPLLSSDRGVEPARHLNPVLSLGGTDHVLVPQFAASIPVSELEQPVGSLAGERYAVLNALDFLITGI